MLAITNLTVGYGRTDILRDLSVTFTPGHITGIIGPNGAGKSTLIKALLNLIKPRQGQILLNDTPVKSQLNQIAYVQQRADLDLSFPIDVEHVVLTGVYPQLKLFHEPTPAMHDAVTAAIDQVGLTDFKHRQFSALSGGQLQRVFVARALVQQAQVLILDEPFVGIDLASETQIMAILRELTAAGKTVIIVHHDLNKVTTYFDDLVILNHGVIAAGSTERVFTRSNIGQAFSEDLGKVLFIEEVNNG
ncbi:metal ABC transporter ATP-binding protein [Lacticaseibacillus brantae]|uniref:ABC transporter family protein n=1 Tax=Lacticaseibacillus brantae DSM 23927 TaxID=1423727 RepID=A0A0R2AVG8_9LACO|nr:metal ABC transporter ATP-binding protein [Lacticaseibacillus brantae]KRM71229.1 ABC transporter family protein [Lacticaseibacillus brantae DSM 23927]